MITMNSFGSRHRFYHESRHAQTHNTKIDMTPMVAVAFLLLAFLLVTVNIKKPQTMSVAEPDKGAIFCGDRLHCYSSTTVILSDSNKVYWYNGLADPELHVTDFSNNGLRKLLLQGNATIVKRLKRLEKQYLSGKMDKNTYTVLAAQEKASYDGVTIVIKTDKKAKFINMVDMLDELKICGISRYTFADLDPVEEKKIADYNASLCEK